MHAIAHASFFSVFWLSNEICTYYVVVFTEVKAEQKIRNEWTKARKRTNVYDVMIDGQNIFFIIMSSSVLQSSKVG